MNDKQRNLCDRSIPAESKEKRQEHRNGDTDYLKEQAASVEPQ
jgi:hypothetical protein